VWLWTSGTLHLFFLALPVWLLTALLYVALAAVAGARDTREPGSEAALEAADPASGAARAPELGPRTPAGTLAGLVALVALVACLALPLWVYRVPAGEWDARLAVFKGWILAVTAVYFVAGVLWMGEERKRRPAPAR
jgi:NCS1 family nucleobase:cation symporter-1